MKFKKEQINIFVSVFTIFLIVAHIFVLTESSKNYVKTQVYNELQKITAEKSEKVQLYINYSLSSIKSISNSISMNLSGSESENIVTILESYIKSTPFSSIEFFDKTGINSGSNSALNASTLPFFINGLRGKSGIWINYAHRSTKNSAIYFYAPLYLNSEVIGVIAGIIGGDDSLKKLLDASYYKKNIIGFLFDDDSNVIASTKNIMKPGIRLMDYYSEPLIAEVLSHVSSNDTDAFSYFANKTEGICCAEKLPETKWYISYLVEPKEYANSLSFYKKSVFTIFIFCTSIMVVYLIFMLYMNKKSGKEKEAELKRIIDSMGLIYENVAILNCKTGKVVFYKMGKEIADFYGTSTLSGDYEEITASYIQAQVWEDDRELFKEVETVKGLQQKLGFNREYSLGYKVMRDNQLHYFQVQYLKSTGYSSDIVIAIKNVDKIMEKEQADRNQLNTLIESQASQLRLLSSMAGIYLTTHIFDLKKNFFVEINSTKEVNSIVDGNTNACEQLAKVMEETTLSEYVEVALAFTNLKTVAKRLKGKKIISEEFRNKTYGWIRASFIPVELDEEELPVKVLYVTQLIEDEKKREEKLITTANRDELTGLLNRHAYEEELRRLKSVPLRDDFIYISMDVNGLKVTNDTLGHVAGDELLCGAAECIRKCFKPYGNVYRTGGDEFQILIYADENKIEEIRNNFETEVSKWTGKYVAELNISAGYVCRREDLSKEIKDIEKLADERMYKAKSEFYSSKGVDRRGQQVAYEVLCQSYEKILRVDLLKDSFTVIQMNKDEKIEELGYSDKISAWFYNFGSSGMVHRDDRFDYFGKTDLYYIRDYFSNGGQLLSIQYRRKINKKFSRVLMEMVPAKDYSKTNQIIYLYVKKIDK